MRSDFEEANLAAYYVLLNGCLDVLLWCVAPYVDDSREFGVFRRGLAMVTTVVLGAWLRLRARWTHGAPVA